MKIVPDYRKNIKCYYCNNNNAVDSCGNLEELICVSKNQFTSYDYIKVSVEVPRCKECEKKHSLSMLPMLICFLVLFILAIIKFIIPQWDEHSIGENILYILLMLFLTLLGGSLIGFIPRMIVSSLLKVKYEDDTDGYSPIRKLKGIGFRKDKPKAHTHPRALFNKERYESTLASIVQNDNCVIK